MLMCSLTHPGPEGHLLERLGPEQSGRLPGNCHLLHLDSCLPCTQLVPRQKQAVKWGTTTLTAAPWNKRTNKSAIVNLVLQSITQIFMLDGISQCHWCKSKMFLVSQSHEADPLLQAGLKQECHSDFGSNKERKKDTWQGKQTTGKDLTKARKRLSRQNSTKKCIYSRTNI